MSLIKCTECGSELSDKAKACPHCGIPMKEIQKILNPPKEEEKEQQSEQISYMASAVAAEEKTSSGGKKGFVFLLISVICSAAYLGFYLSMQILQNGLIEKLQSLTLSVDTVIAGIRSADPFWYLLMQLILMCLAVLAGLIGLSAGNRFFAFLMMLCYSGAIWFGREDYLHLIASAVSGLLGFVFLCIEKKRT